MRADEELRAQFGELRRADEAGAPAFSVVDRRRAVRSSVAIHRQPGTWLAAAAAAIVAVVATQRFRAAHESSASPVANWQSPTGSLVPTGGRTVLAPPPLLSSVLDGATSSVLWHKGD